MSMTWFTMRAEANSSALAFKVGLQNGRRASSSAGLAGVTGKPKFRS